MRLESASEMKSYGFRCELNGIINDTAHSLSFPMESLTCIGIKATFNEPEDKGNSTKKLPKIFLLGCTYLVDGTEMTPGSGQLILKS